MFVNIKIDGKEIKALKGDTILKTAIRLNIDIPHLCTNNLFKSNLSKCSMCLVKVKYKNNTEECYEKLFACETIVKEGMSILNETSQYIKNYRNTVLNSLLSTHKPTCNQCNVYSHCKLKDYFNKYEIKNNENIKKTENAVIENRIEKTLLEEIEMSANYERCIECGICKTYKENFIKDNHKTKIFDLCPTKVFIPKKLLNTDFNKIKKTEGYCIDCENICRCEIYSDDKEAVMLGSDETSKYGICDFAFHLKSQEKLTPLIYTLKNGLEEQTNEVSELYNNFFNKSPEEDTYAFISTYFPKEDIDAAEEEVKRLNIKNYFFESTKVNTDSNVKKRNTSNFNYVFTSKDKNKISENFFKNQYSTNSIFFIIASPAILKDIDFINFTKKHSGNYIIFTSYHCEASREAYLAFHIKMFYEFGGEYIDRNRIKKTINFEECNNSKRYSLKDIFNFLKAKNN